MPNIELHGFLGMDGNEQDTTWARDFYAMGIKVAAFSELIEKALAGAAYEKETVLTTYVSTSGRTNDDPSTPFLRIWATRKEVRDDIVRRLEPLDIDMELPPLLDDFIPRRSERKEAEPQGWLKGLTKPGHAALEQGGPNETEPAADAFNKRFAAQGLYEGDKPIFKDRVE